MRDTPNARVYSLVTETLWKLFNGKSIRTPIDYWELLLFGNPSANSAQEEKIIDLSIQVRTRRQVALNDLGLENETEWLNQQGVLLEDAPAFWEGYLQNLEKRGITNFTVEQRDLTVFKIGFTLITIYWLFYQLVLGSR